MKAPEIKLIMKMLNNREIIPNPEGTLNQACELVDAAGNIHGSGSFKPNA
jgi:hypothetical protein